MAGKKKTTGGGMGLRVLAVAAALTAGGYFLYGKDGAKNRKKVKSWMLKARAEVLEQMEKLRDMDQADYIAVVDKVMKRYETMKDVSAKESSALARELKSHWKHIKAAHAKASKTK